MAYLLIVDDDEDFANAASKFLSSAGHDVSIVLDTASAVKSMEQKRPDLLILDVMFPENAAAGFELARTINERKRDFKGVPILMLTAVNAKYPLGFGSQDIDDDWMPVTDFLEKPADFEVLRRKVAALVEKT